MYIIPFFDLFLCDFDKIGLILGGHFACSRLSSLSQISVSDKKRFPSSRPILY